MRMENVDELARWLKAIDSLGGVFDQETDELARAWRQSCAKLESAIRESDVSPSCRG